MSTFVITKIFLLTTFSFILTLILTPFLTHFLYKYHLGKGIRDEKAAPIFASMHKKKAGTPTMGGILIWGTTLVLSLIIYVLAIFFNGFFNDLNFLTRSETFLPLGAMIFAALIGVVDDLIDIRKMGKGVSFIMGS